MFGGHDLLQDIGHGSLLVRAKRRGWALRAKPAFLQKQIFWSVNIVCKSPSRPIIKTRGQLMPETLAAPGLLAPAPRRAQYRDYQQAGIDRVREFYRNNHSQQTLRFVLEKKTVGCSSSNAV